MKPIVVRSAVALVAGVFLVGCVEQERVAPAATSHPPAQTAGATNMQSVAPAQAQSGVEGSAPGTAQDYSTHATRVVALASQQIERLERPSTANGNRSRVVIDTALADLESKRAKVLEDTRELGAQPAGQDDGALAEMDRCANLAALETAVRASYSILPPPSQGRP
jgi:hypothetical protein